MTPKENSGFGEIDLDKKSDIEVDLGQDGEEILLLPLTEEQKKESRLALEKLQKRWGKSRSITADEKLFYHFCEQYAYRGKTFCEMMRVIIRQRDLSSVKFNRKTELDKGIYSNIMQDTKDDDEKTNSYIADKRIIMSICVGLELDEKTGRELLKASGLYFCPSRFPDIVYEYVLKHHLGNDIPGLPELLKEHSGNRITAINEILENLGLEKTECLGSQQRPKKERD